MLKIMTYELKDDSGGEKWFFLKKIFETSRYYEKMCDGTAGVGGQAQTNAQNIIIFIKTMKLLVTLQQDLNFEKKMGPNG